VIEILTLAVSLFPATVNNAFRSSVPGLIDHGPSRLVGVHAVAINPAV
jgi:hypothetical protein